MHLFDLNKLTPGPGNWPNLGFDYSGAHSRQCDLLFEIADAELNSDKTAHWMFDTYQRGHKDVRELALRGFARQVQKVAERNREVYKDLMGNHTARLLAWALLTRWIASEK